MLLDKRSTEKHASPLRSDCATSATNAELREDPHDVARNLAAARSFTYDIRFLLAITTICISRGQIPHAVQTSSTTIPTTAQSQPQSPRQNVLLLHQQLKLLHHLHHLHLLRGPNDRHPQRPSNIHGPLRSNARKNRTSEPRRTGASPAGELRQPGAAVGGWGYGAVED